MTVHRAIAHLVFAFLLLLSQQLGIVHAISHLPEEVSAGVHKKHSPGKMQCDQCVAFAAIGAGLPGASSSVPQLAAPAAIPIEAARTRLLPAAIRAFDSRAPPVLI